MQMSMRTPSSQHLHEQLLDSRGPPWTADRAGCTTARTCIHNDGCCINLLQPPHMFFILEDSAERLNSHAGCAYGKYALEWYICTTVHFVGFSGWHVDPGLLSRLHPVDSLKFLSWKRLGTPPSHNWRGPKGEAPSWLLKAASWTIS